MQTKHVSRLLVLASGLVLVATGASSRAGPAGAPATRPAARRAVPVIYHQPLSKQGIEPTAEGLQRYLVSWVPRSVDPDQIAKLIEQLGDERFQMREQATRALISMWPACKAAIRKAMTSSDPEISARAAMIYGRSLTRPADLALALRVIEHARLQGMVPTLLRVLPHCPNDSTRERIWSAIVALAKPGDAGALVKALDGGPDAARIGAAIGLLKLGNRRVLAGLAPVEDKGADALRLAAARLRCFAGRRESLATLCRLLKSPEADVRSAAALTLYDLTGKPMAFSAFDATASAPQADRWGQSLAKDPPRLPPALKSPAPYWPRNVALDKAVTSAVRESPKYCLSLGLQASCLTDGVLATGAAPGSCRIDYTIDLRRTTGGLDLAARLRQGCRINRIVVEWKSFGATRPNRRGGVWHYVQKYELMYQPVGSTRWQRIHQCNVPPVKEPAELSRRPLVLKYVPDNRRTMIAGLNLRRVGRLRLIASGPEWLGAFELQAYGVAE
jgi:hypothetical protein